MDDARTQRMLDAIADLYLTGRDAPSHRHGQEKDVPPSHSRPVRLPPKLRVRQGGLATPAWQQPTSDPVSVAPLDGSCSNGESSADAPPSMQGVAQAVADRPTNHVPAFDHDASAMPATSSSSVPPGPARPWREVRQQRRDQYSPSAPRNAPAPRNASEPPASSTVSAAAAELGDASASSESTGAAQAASDEPVLIDAQAVFLGNLPGFGRPWLTQYAQQLARQSRNAAVAIIHLEEADQLTLDIVTPADVQGVSFTTTPGNSPLEVLAHLAHHPVIPVTRWLCHLPLPASDDAPDMAALAHDLDQWTLLLGGDEAAVAHAREWLSQAAQGDRRAAWRRVGVAIMGCQEDQGRQVAETLRSGLDPALAQGLSLRDVRPQMAPVHLHRIGQFDEARTHWPELMAFLSACESDHAAAQAESSPASAQGAFALPADRRLDVQAADLFGAPRDTSHQEQMEHPVQSPVDEDGQAVDDPVSPSAAPAWQPVSTGEPASSSQAASSSGLDLSRWLPAGAVVLEARCPHQPRVQLALDAAGRLHLLAQTGISLREAALDLLEVVQWAKAHQPLLELTRRDLAWDRDAQPVAHLFTDQAIAAVTMARQVGDLLRLHLLQAVEVAGQITWAASPLN